MVGTRTVQTARPEHRGGLRIAVVDIFRASVARPSRPTVAQERIATHSDVGRGVPACGSRIFVLAWMTGTLVDVALAGCTLKTSFT